MCCCAYIIAGVPAVLKFQKCVCVCVCVCAAAGGKCCGVHEDGSDASADSIVSSQCCWCWLWDEIRPHTGWKHSLWILSHGLLLLLLPEICTTVTEARREPQDQAVYLSPRLYTLRLRLTIPDLNNAFVELTHRPCWMLVNKRLTREHWIQCMTFATETNVDMPAVAGWRRATRLQSWRGGLAAGLANINQCDLTWFKSWFKSIDFLSKKLGDLNCTHFRIFQFILCCKASYI